MTKLDQSGSHRPAGDGRDAISRRLVAGNVVFFPMATAYAIFALPASVFAMLGLTGAFPALASTTGHAHEMLFGFALAVIVGNQVGPVSRPRLALLAGLWVIARATFLCAPQSIAAATANIAFAALLAMQFAPRLLGAAKKWRNQALPLALAGVQTMWDPRIALAYRTACAIGAAGTVLAMAAFVGMFATWFGMLMLPLVPIVAANVFNSTFDRLAKARLERVERQLPYALEFLAMAMKANATIDQALIEYCRSAPAADSLALEFRLLQRDQLLGLGAQEAFSNLALRLPSRVIQTFASAVEHGMAKGQSMTVVLSDQAQSARAIRYQSAERTAKDAALKATAPLMMSGVSCFLALLAPLALNFRSAL